MHTQRDFVVPLLMLCSAASWREVGEGVHSLHESHTLLVQISDTAISFLAQVSSLKPQFYHITW